jgi:hypothetical protein
LVGIWGQNLDVCYLSDGNAVTSLTLTTGGQLTDKKSSQKVERELRYKTQAKA